MSWEKYNFIYTKSVSQSVLVTPRVLNPFKENDAFDCMVLSPALFYLMLND